MGLFNFFKKKEEKTKQEPEDYEVVRLLHSYDVGAEALSLSEIINHSEAILVYLDDVLGVISDKKVDLVVIEMFSRKLNTIIKNGMDIKNLLEYLIKAYHEPTLKILNKVLEIKSSELVICEFNNLEKHKNLIMKLVESLNALVAYRALLKFESLEEIGKTINKALKSTEMLQDLRDVKHGIADAILNNESGLSKNVHPDVLKHLHEEIYGQNAG